jgi:hypothetical protein
MPQARSGYSTRFDHQTRIPDEFVHGMNLKGLLAGFSSVHGTLRLNGWLVRTHGYGAALWRLGEAHRYWASKSSCRRSRTSERIAAISMWRFACRSDKLTSTSGTTTYISDNIAQIHVASCSKQGTKYMVQGVALPILSSLPKVLCRSHDGKASRELEAAQISFRVASGWYTGWWHTR